MGICAASLEALFCSATILVPQGHPNNQRQLEHSVPKVAGKESWCSGESLWLPPAWTSSFAYPAGCGRSDRANTSVAGTAKVLYL